MEASQNQRPEFEDKPFEDKGLGEASQAKKTKRHNKNFGGIIYLAIFVFALFVLILPAYTKLKEINDALDRINDIPLVYSPGEKVIIGNVK